jgi:dolichol-phosphate mannosyltransferase
MISIVTPAFNEAGNLEALYTRLAQALDRVADGPGMAWEWLIVDDHSRDETFAVIERLALLDARVRGIRLSRNCGSHVAITCGLHNAQGDAAIMMAGDLQDPPELIERMIDAWRKGSQVVWAVRRTPPDVFATVYYWIMRRVVGMKEMPANGADFFLVDRTVLEAFRRCPERNVSVLALLTWIGFTQTHIEYDKQPRVAGKTGWTRSRQITLVIDSITAFSDFPIHLFGYAGAVLLAGGVLLAVAGAFLLPSLGAGLLFVLAAIVGLSGVQLLGLAVLGAYLWRALEHARGRPQYIIERVAVHGSVTPASLR